MDMQTCEARDSRVMFQTSQGESVDSRLLSLTRYAATFEIYNPETLIRTSEVLHDFKFLVGERTVYSGHTVVHEGLNTGTAHVCSVLLDDFGFNQEGLGALGQNDHLKGRLTEFIKQWQTVCKVKPEFKVVVADIETFLVDLRRWMEQIELGIRSSHKLDQERQERAIIDELSPQVISALDCLFEGFELIYLGLDKDECPVHRSYVQRHLHPIVLCAPFAYRCYRKPLGYAGDYEMVSMMLRDPREGSSLFAKIFNVWLLNQKSAAAHRNRITYLKQRLIEECARAAREGRKARILNLGCGPAQEIQEFLVQSELSDFAKFTLLDFNDETLQHTTEALNLKKRDYGRKTIIELAKKSVQQVLKDSMRSQELCRGQPFDLIYCAGLFDYLPDHICKNLMTIFYGSVVPGGLVLATNVAPEAPNRGSLELILDWHLIYRDAAKVATLRPNGLTQQDVDIQSDETAVNVFLEARKPHAV
jgi:extracellular factor (EF) 3-hydroxypalmitic acid methyl ester biosynthesis protein